MEHSGGARRHLCIILWLDPFLSRLCCLKTAVWWMDPLQIFRSTSWWHLATSCSCRSWTPLSAGERSWWSGLLAMRRLSCDHSSLFRFSAFVCSIRSGFSESAHRSLLKEALGELAGRLKEGSAELTLDQLVKWEIYWNFFFYSLTFHSS